ncbi:hypothetical protein B9Z65_8923 [Elsinoe australis]|uniref:Zn(2)-C6 fungal-type domain-containing protein n=1 Tax=Elsinoe australis TaxID=40998 RepID=A0A2P7YBQ2_9PEZI|nr:hypothetical protein B9Z65_8923 [Elsinoe australis]
MPQAAKTSSTVRRQRLADFIESEGTRMVKPCQTCARHGRVCKIHVRSGKCSECLRRGQRCDVKVAESEWKRLKDERIKLRRKLSAAQDAQRQARNAEEQARRALNAAFEKEMRIRQEMDMLEDRAAEAISVEEANIEEQEAAEAATLQLDPSCPGFSLSPSTWNALDGGFSLDSEFWLEFPDTGQGGGGPVISADSLLLPLSGSGNGVAPS